MHRLVSLVVGSDVADTGNAVAAVGDVLYGFGTFQGSATILGSTLNAVAANDVYGFATPIP